MLDVGITKEDVVAEGEDDVLKEEGRVENGVSPRACGECPLRRDD